MRLLIFFAIMSMSLRSIAQGNIVWQIGKIDKTGKEFALYQKHYKDFVARFGGENTVYNVGYSKDSTDWPYVMPGPLDGWGGGGYWAGFYPRHFPRVFFQLPQQPVDGKFQFVIGFADASKKNAPAIQIDINGHRTQQQLDAGTGASLTDSLATGKTQLVVVDVPANWLKKGINVIQLGSVSGSWSVFDYLQLRSDKPLKVTPAYSSLIASAQAAPFEYNVTNKRIQPLLLDIYQLNAGSELNIAIEGLKPVTKKIESGHSILEVDMPAVPSSAKKINSHVVITSGSDVIYDGQVTRSPQPLYQYTDYVDLLIGTGNSRWMFKPGPSLPLSMVQIAPDNQDQTWKAGYEYTVDNIMGFSHFSDWTMCGLLMMPTTGKLQVDPGREDHPDEGYRSRIDKKTENAKIGNYSVYMTDTHIKAEISAARRASIQRYTFPASDSARILVDMFTPNEYPHNLVDTKITKVSNTEIEGYATYYNAFTGYTLQQSYTVYFVMQVNKPFESMGGWVNKNVPVVKGYIPEWKMNYKFDSLPEIFNNVNEITGKGDAGIFLNYKTKKGEQIVVRTGVSLVDVKGARNNLETEITKPFNFDFDGVVRMQKKVWNEYLGRIDIQTDDYLQKVKFYTNFYRALSAKAIWSDADGRFRDENEQVQKLSGKDDCIVSGEYWNTFWDNQQLFNLAAPEISSKWARSAIALYKNSGWFNTDPAGIEHTGVMVAMHMASQIQGAWQSGIHDFDLPLAFEGLKKMMTTPPQKFAGGGTVGVEDIVPYQRYGYVPRGKGAVSNTMEYAYDDYCLAQMALVLGKQDDYLFFQKRSESWKNLMDSTTGFIRPKDDKGNWITPFDPYHTPGFVEGNAFNYSWYVPQDPPALVAAVGRERFVSRLDSAMYKSSFANFNALGDDFANYPINHGNEPCMEVAYLFNWAGRPDLTQKWARAIQEQYYGVTPYDGYPGDEDLGQMSSWFVMSAIGLFQMDGGCSQNPIYELGSPRYPKITINLGGRYGRGKQFIIEATGASKENKYVTSATLNGKPLNDFKILQQDVLKGGKLELNMQSDTH